MVKIEKYSLDNDYNKIQDALAEHESTPIYTTLDTTGDYIFISNEPFSIVEAEEQYPFESEEEMLKDIQEQETEELEDLGDFIPDVEELE